eukprot:TRINITY_DN7911_c0_g1_i1.p1 TRINITY_DN7911_c0_g1~~TRINITY_DN7911_c0_g1_i1.p1  ORF type:complete len:530 (+),score=64.83 TRINITY_DN7911_c0_g1_i1:122-1591(+)
MENKRRRDDRSPRSPRVRSRSPRARSPRIRSPRPRSPRDRPSPVRARSPRERSPRNKTPPRIRSPRRDRRSDPRREESSTKSRDSYRKRNSRGTGSSGRSRGDVISVYVGNLSYKTHKDELWDLFAEHGPVFAVELPREHQGFGFVKMSAHDAESAIRSLDGYLLHQRHIRVNDAHREVPTRAEQASPRKDKSYPRSSSTREEPPRKRPRKDEPSSSGHNSLPNDAFNRLFSECDSKIILSILKHVKYWRVLLAMSGVNTRLKQLARSPELWKSLFIERWSQWPDVHSEVLLNSAKLLGSAPVPWFKIFRREFMNRNDTIPEKLLRPNQEHRLQDYVRKKKNHILVEVANFYELLQRRDLLQKIKDSESKFRRDRYLCFLTPTSFRDEPIESIVKHLKSVPIVHDKNSENARLLYGIERAERWEKHSQDKIHGLIRDADEDRDRFSGLTDAHAVWQSASHGSDHDDYLFVVVGDFSTVLGAVSWVSKRA